jgi:hypothetical protein
MSFDPRPQVIILAACVLAAFVGFDLVRTLRTGRGRPSKFGTATRKQPGRFARYVYADWIMLAFCLALILWALIWPDTFGR